MSLGTGGNAATFFAFHFPAATKPMHQASKHSTDIPGASQVPCASPFIARGTAVMNLGGE